MMDRAKVQSTRLRVLLSDLGFFDPDLCDGSVDTNRAAWVANDAIRCRNLGPYAFIESADLADWATGRKLMTRKQGEFLCEALNLDFRELDRGAKHWDRLFPGRDWVRGHLFDAPSPVPAAQ